MAHAYTGRAITRAVKCGARTIEHGNLVDDAAAQVMAEYGAFAVPTLVTYDATVQFGAQYGVPPEALSKVSLTQTAGKKSLEIFARHGVPMGYGSDLLGEMHSLQSGEFAIRAGVLGNLEAIRSATTVAADIVNMSGQLGTLRTGAIADILVVNGNPLRDISVLANSEFFEWVIQNGKVRKEPQAESRQ
ncbi:amidohydrolase family protein [Paraburkholderia sp. BL18I3N2]|nr:amidohydrolase family protein [Paraburkholderia sp. BL18I3N2]